MTSDPQVDRFASLGLCFLCSFKNGFHDGVEGVGLVVSVGLVLVGGLWVREQGLVKPLVHLSIKVFASVYPLDGDIDQVLVYPGVNSSPDIVPVRQAANHFQKPFMHGCKNEKRNSLLNASTEVPLKTSTIASSL